MSNEKHFTGTTENKLVAEAMTHVDTFLFDVLSDDELSYAGAPTEPELDLSKPAAKQIDGDLVFIIRPGAKVTLAQIQTAQSKTALRTIIVAAVSQKPSAAMSKENLLLVLTTAVTRLTELSS